MAVIALNEKDKEIDALAINAIANEIRPTVAGIWDLNSTSAVAPALDKVTFFTHKIPGQESVLDGGDERVEVPKADLLPGGRYRCESHHPQLSSEIATNTVPTAILKLFVTYERLVGKYAHGTAWLIRPDLAVTAGHNLFNWQNNGGAAVKIKAYSGYYGKASIDKPEYQVEFREGKRCITTDRWLMTRGSKPFDVGFIKFDPPFTNITPVKFAETPITGNEKIGVVGYPADRIDDNEKGARMYDMYLDTAWELQQQPDTMLAYSIDTEGGEYLYLEGKNESSQRQVTLVGPFYEQQMVSRLVLMSMEARSIQHQS